MKRTTALFLALMAAGAVNVAQAGSETGIYVGGSLADSTIGDLDGDTGYKLFAGYNLGLVPMVDLSIEGAYMDFGEPDLDEDGSLGATGIAAMGVAGFGVGPIGLFGKLGMVAWDWDLNADEGDDSDSGNDPLIGVGAKFQIDALAVRVEYEQIDLDGDDIDFISAGVAFTF